jgi:hypothetical protein
VKETGCLVAVVQGAMVADNMFGGICGIFVVELGKKS